MAGELLEARDVVDGEKVVDVAERGLHSARQRLVLRRAEQRVEPDQPPAAAAHARELTAEEPWISTVPSIRHDEHDGAVSHDAARPSRVERAERFAYPRTASPVPDVARKAREHIAS